MANAEADTHNLIVPRWTQFQKGEFANGLYRNNAWLLDDKFMTFQTVLSDQRMDTIIDAITLQNEVVVERGRPDIAMIFSADPKENTAVDVVVIEIKKKAMTKKKTNM